MSSQQSLGAGTGIAAELDENLQSISIAEFFEKNKHMLGFDSDAKSLVTAVKEAVDNSLDACEDAGILPDIYVEIQDNGDYYKLIVEDNGPGITKNQIPNVFGKLLYGSRFHSREQTRGQQGIGISAAVLYSQLTSGKEAKVTSKTQSQDEPRYFELIIDTDSNDPDIRKEEKGGTLRDGFEHGTRIELEMEANLRARQQLLDYIRYTGVVNPHARLTLVEPKGEISLDRTTEQMPEETEEIAPHPHGVELGALKKMLENTDSYSLSGFLTDEFVRVGAKTAEKISDRFIDYWHGRDIVWTLPEDRETLNEEIKSVIQGKKDFEAAGFTDEFIENMENKQPVGFGDVKEATQNAAQSAADEFGRPFGETVRGKAAERAWDVITEDVEDGVYEVVDDVTTSRKSASAVEDLSRKLAVRLSEEGRKQITREELSDLVARTTDSVDGSFGDKSQTKIIDGLWERMKTPDEDLPKVSDFKDSRDMVAVLKKSMDETSVQSPPTDCLSPITEDLIISGLKKVYNAEFYTSVTRSADSYSGEPFVVEAGLAYGGDIENEKFELMRFANRVPLVYQRGACAMTTVVRNVDWRNYFPSGSGLSQSGGDGIPQGPVALLVHVASTNVPFTSESKDAMASVEEIEEEIKRAVWNVGRELNSHLSHQRSLEKKRRKKETVAEVLPSFAQKAAKVAGADSPADVKQSLARITNSVLISHRVDDDGKAVFGIDNNNDKKADFTVKQRLSREPSNVPDDISVEEDGDEWVLSWSGEVEVGDGVEYTYDWTTDGRASVEIETEGIETERVVEYNG